MRRSTKQRRAAARRNCHIAFLAWVPTAMSLVSLPPCLCRPVNPQHKGNQ